MDAKQIEEIRQRAEDAICHPDLYRLWDYKNIVAQDIPALIKAIESGDHYRDQLLAEYLKLEQRSRGIEDNDDKRTT